MTDSTLNQHGDRLVIASAGHGSDIATQRADDLDLMAVEAVKSMAKPCYALDAGCGLGGQAIRLAEAGAEVVATDIADVAAEVASGAEKAGVADRVSFRRGDLRFIADDLAGCAFDIICCQRAIHYLSWAEAVAAVTALGRMLRPKGRLFISASGIGSELGDGYPGATLPLATRYAPLASEMATKHGIHGPVCLYFLNDLQLLIKSAGLIPLHLFVSPFGNVKAVAATP